MGGYDFDNFVPDAMKANVRDTYFEFYRILNYPQGNSSRGVESVVSLKASAEGETALHCHTRA